MYGATVPRALPPIGFALLALGLPAAGLAATSAQAGSPLGSLALTVLTDHTAVKSGDQVRATLVVRSTGTEPATSVTTCLLPPPQLTVKRATGGERRGRRVCFTLGDLAAGTEQLKVITLAAVAARTVNVRMTAGATSTCQCSERLSARSPVIRIVSRQATPKVTG